MLDFPASPTTGQIYVSGPSWRWDGSKWVAYSSSAIAGPYLPLAGGVLSGALSIKGNTIATPPVFGPFPNRYVGFSIAPPDGQHAVALLDSWGNGVSPRLAFRQASGTAAAPLNSGSGSVLGIIEFHGRGDTQYAPQGGASQIYAAAAEAWTDAAMGSSLVLSVTAPGTIICSPVATFLSTGITFNTNLTISQGAGGWPSLVLTKAASGTGCQIISYTGANLRWVINPGNNAAESGSNSGSDFSIDRYTDAGAWINAPFAINRATGLTSIASLALGVPLPVASGGTGSATASGALTNLGAAPATSLGNYLPLTGGTLSGDLTAPNVRTSGSFFVNGLQIYNNGGWVYTGNGFLTSGQGLYSYTTMHCDGACSVGGDITVTGRTITPRLDIYGGVFYNGYGDGWLYFNGSLRVGNFNSQNDVSANGSFYIGGSLRLYNNGGWNWFDVGVQCANLIARSGDITANSGNISASGSLFAGGCQLYNGAGWLRTPQPFFSDSTVHASSNVEAGNDFSCGYGVYRCYGHRGAKIECPGWDYDWVSPFVSQGYLYTTPDYSGGPFFANAGWWSDARLKRNIRDSEIDALAAIMATPVRAFEYTEFGQSLQPWVKETEAKIGLVAQELQPNIPLAVKECAWEHKSLFIDMNFVMPYLFRAVQQLAEQITEKYASLADRLTALEEKIG